jgi:ribosome-binding factor A
MKSDRMRRVDEAVREVLSDAIATDIKDPRVGFVTVTAVDTSPDLRHAKVFVSVLGHAGVRARSMDGLRSAHGYLQRRVSDELHLKHTPALSFVYDDTAERAQRLQRLLGDDGE